MASYGARILCASASQGKGFGGQSQKDAPAPGRKGRKDVVLKTKKLDNNAAVNKALELVEKSQGPSSADIKDTGRVDYVRVENWGSGKAEDLGDLKLAEKPQELTADVKFYEELARHLQVLQFEGVLAVARPKSAPPIPPFQRWAFAEAHYQQHLADLLRVHSALEETHSAVVKHLKAAGSNAEYIVSVTEAFSLLGPETGLSRAEQISRDLKAMKATAAEDGSSSSSISSKSKPSEVEASPNAATYAQHINEIAVQCGRAENEAELANTAARYLAHNYVTMLTLLTSGTRLGAAAAEKLDLFQRDALHTYRTYPESAVNPLATFVKAVDSVGEVLEGDQRESFMSELPDAFRRSSLLLEALARDN